MEIELSQNETAQKADGENDVKALVSTSFAAMGNGRSFNALLKGVQVLSAAPPTILARLTVADEHTNDAGVMHTGFAAAMADVLTAATVRITAAQQTPVVSVDLTIAIVQPARIGDILLMEANCLQADLSIAFTEAIFRRKSDGQMIVKASQQLAILHYLSLKPKGKGGDGNDTKKGPTTDCEQQQQQNGLTEADRTNGGQQRSDADGGTTDEAANLDRAEKLVARRGNAKNFNRMAENLRVTRAEPFVLEAEIELGSKHLNEGGTMHGGFVATLVDIVSCCVVELAAPNSSLKSLFVSISYLLPAKIGERIVIKSECLKVGRSITFTETTVSRKGDGAVLAKAKHNISMARNSDGTHQRGKEGKN
ncbi:hypothetical protein niasHT_022878 [Heterodera trifolii]|uniref:Thioesterase domain-containing protein n=1 Tax=Heterodera trifolii TaxID=157864 RepID=A0ABD2KJC7_9BILA